MTSKKIPSFHSVVFAIGKVTFQELIRDKILYNIVLISVLLLGAGFVASRLTFIRPERVVLDFGISAINLACALIAIFGGSSLLGREWERRTAQVALSHPITRSQFVLGKFWGILSVLFINWGLLACAHFLILSFTAPQLNAFLHATYILALFFIFIQSAIIVALAIFFSTFSTTSVSIIISIGCYLIGNNISYLKNLLLKVHSFGGSFFLKGIIYLFPNYEYFNLGSKVTYGLEVGWPSVLMSIGYGVAFTFFVLLLSGWLIRVKEQ